MNAEVSSDCAGLGLSWVRVSHHGAWGLDDVVTFPHLRKHKEQKECSRFHVRQRNATVEVIEMPSPWRPRALRSCNLAHWGRRALSSGDSSAQPGDHQTPSQHTHVRCCTLPKHHPTWSPQTSVPVTSSDRPAWSLAAQTAALSVPRDVGGLHRASPRWGSAPGHLDNLVGQNSSWSDHQPHTKHNGDKDEYRFTHFTADKTHTEWNRHVRYLGEFRTDQQRHDARANEWQHAINCTHVTCPEKSWWRSARSLSARCCGLHVEKEVRLLCRMILGLARWMRTGFGPITHSSGHRFSTTAVTHMIITIFCTPPT